MLQNAAEGVQIEIERARGVKCERCWKYTEDVGAVPELPTVCAFCAGAVQEILAANQDDVQDNAR